MQLVAKTMSCDKAIKEKGYKLTPQRRLILDVFHASKTHLTGEELVNQIQARAPGVNKSTVYRTLDLPESLELAAKSELEGRFVYHHGESAHHHHFVCRGCGKIVDCDETILLPLEKTLVEKFDFEPDFKHLMIYGLCGACIRDR